MTTAADLFTEAADRLTMENWGKGAMAGKNRVGYLEGSIGTVCPPWTEDAKYFCAEGMVVRVAYEHGMFELGDRVTETEVQGYNFMDSLIGASRATRLRNLNDDLPLDEVSLENVKVEMRHIADDLRSLEGDQ